MKGEKTEKWKKWSGILFATPLLLFFYERKEAGKGAMK
jgi:hypothetical protein